MIKRYLGLSLVAAGLVMAGCSSSDDDDPPAPEPVACDPCDAASLNLLETATNDANLSSFVTAMGDAGLTALSDSANITVFAPSNEAFAATDTSALTTEELADLLNYHITAGVVPLASLTDGSTLTMANGKTADVTVDGDVISVGGVAVGNTDDLYATNGLLHTLGGVLTVPEDPVEPEPTEPTDPGGDMGPVESAVAASGNFSEFLNQFNNSIGNPALDDTANAWTVFAPTNTALSGATINIQDYVYVNGALDAASLGALTEITTNNGTTYPVTNTGGVITVGGSTVAEIASGSSVVYSIDGLL